MQDRVKLEKFKPILGIAVTYLSSLFPYIILAILSPSMRRSISIGKRSIRLFWKVGLIIGAAHLCTYYALSHGDVSMVSPLMNVQPLFVFLLARIFLRELEKITTSSSWEHLS